MKRIKVIHILQTLLLSSSSEKEKCVFKEEERLKKENHCFDNIICDIIVIFSSLISRWNFVIGNG